MFVPNSVEAELREQFNVLAICLTAARLPSTSDRAREEFFKRAEDTARQTLATVKRLQQEGNEKGQEPRHAFGAKP